MSFELGVRRLDVTPEVGGTLAGYAARTQPSTGVYHPLTATVLALSDGATSLLVVSIEWLGSYDLASAVRESLGKSTGVAADHILLLGTHTHCGPPMRGLDARRHGDGTLDEAYLSNTIDRLAEAAAEAMSDRVPVTLSTGSDSCGFAASRRKPDGKGGVLWEPSLEAPHDHEVPVVAARDADGDIRMTLFSYACHPTSTGPILDIGGDYPGFAMAHLESELDGSVALFAKGCGGDQKPNFLDEHSGGFRRASIHEVKDNGISLAESVLRVTASKMRSVEGELRIRSVIATLSTQQLDSEEVDRLSRSTNAAERAWSEHYQAVMAKGIEPERSVAIEVQSITIGSDLAIVTMAGEMSVEYGLRIKRELSAQFSAVIPLGYANGIVGYVPVDRQLPEGGYEVITNQRTLLRTGAFDVGTEDSVMRAVLETVGMA